MSDESQDEGLIEKAKLVMVIRGYESKGRKRRDKGIDLTASRAESDEKILLRVITKPRTKSGVVGVDAVREMSEALEREGYDKGVLVGRRFSSGAKEKMSREGIEMVSEKVMPSFKPQRLYVTINKLIENLCEAKCGRVPEKESDCKGYSKGQYSCEIRVISDDASFHFEHGWSSLLQNDLKRLLAICNSISDEDLSGHLHYEHKKSEAVRALIKMLEGEKT